MESETLTSPNPEKLEIPSCENPTTEAPSNQTCTPDLTSHETKLKVIHAHNKGKSGEIPEVKVGSPSVAPLSEPKMLYRKAFLGVKKTRSLLKESPLALITLLQKQGHSRKETLEQTNILAEDYIYSRLLYLIPSLEDKESVVEKYLSELTEVSKEIQMIGGRLEALYPQLYENISTQVNMPSFKNETAIRRVINCVADTMFKNGQVKWCRIVAMFALAAGVAAECVKGSRPDLVWLSVSTLCEVIDKYALDWIMEQGGWVDLTREYRLITNEARTLWALSGIGASVGFALLWVTSQTF